ncbi:MAG: DUF4276 family protein [Candidatus Limnocylindrales bacterium]|jgi:hypothetical protein
MRIGLVVDGETELDSFPAFCSRLFPNCGHMHVKTLLAPMNGREPPGKIAKACESRLRILSSLGADLGIVVLDLESDTACPGSVATAIAQAVRNISPIPVNVVLKDRMLENWLVADIDAVARLSARFRIRRADRSSVSPDKADRIDALALLRRTAQKKAYDKRRDGRNILASADPRAMASNSRSFRRFLRVLGHPGYQHQSATPQLH